MSELYNSGLEAKDEIPATIKPGMIIAYRLLASDMPNEPNKKWRGKVIRYDETIYIEMLEPGYENLHETISYDQIVAVEN